MPFIFFLIYLIIEPNHETPFLIYFLLIIQDDSGNLLVTEYGLCEYKDHQTLSMQEVPENSAPGQLPRTVDVIIEDDLVDSCKPGDRVAIIGVYKALPGKSKGSLNGVFRLAT